MLAALGSGERQVGHIASVLGSYPKLGSNYSNTAFVTQLVSIIVGPTTSATMTASKVAWITKYLAELGTAEKYPSRGAFVVTLNDAFNPTMRTAMLRASIKGS